MMPFRLLLVLIFTAITLYTGVVVAHHGLDLLPVFFGGALFLSAYLLVASFRADGNVEALLLGGRRNRP